MLGFGKRIGTFFNFKKNKIENEHISEFRRELIKDNFFRLSIMSVLMFVLELYLYSIDTSIFYVGPIIFKFLIFCGLLVPIILYIYFRHKVINNVIALIIQYSFAGLCIVFGASLALYIQDRADLVHMYLLMAFFSGAFIYMHPAGSFLLYLITYMYFLILLPRYVAGMDARAVIIINTAASNIAAWIMSNILWRSKKVVFKNRKLLYLQNKALKEINKKDSMTDLYNHEASLIILSEQIKITKELLYPLSLIIADIDDFKKTNDRYGHLYGDHVIKMVAENIRETSRKTDFVGRYGGEEFIIIMPNTDINSAITLSNRLQENLENAFANENVKITLSGGVTQYSGETLNELIRYTDQKLYVAKKSGKNRFESEKLEI